MTTLWAAMVYRDDLRYLDHFMQSVVSSSVRPDQLLIVDSGHCSGIEEMARARGLHGGPPIEYKSLESTTRASGGFNPSFNFAVSYAADNGFDFMVTMSVRCKPNEDWLGTVIARINRNGKVGMVSTLHVDIGNRSVYSLGHFLSPSGGLYDFAMGSKMDAIEAIKEYLATSSEVIWSPCSGGALYNVKALARVSESLSSRFDTFRPYGFKSYNCCEIGYLMRSFKYEHKVVPEAVCQRDGSQSTSRHPNTCGLLLNQELNRIASIRTFWPDDLASQAIGLYINERRNEKRVTDIDKRIIVTLSNNLARPWSRKELIRTQLERHLAYYQRSRELKHKWKSGDGL